MSSSATPRTASTHESDSMHARRPSPASDAAPSRQRLGGRTVQHWRHGLGVSALGLMLGSAPAYANGIEDLPTRHRLSATEISASGTPEIDALAAGTPMVGTPMVGISPAAERPDAGQPRVRLGNDITRGLAPELLTQMMLHAGRKGMTEFSGMDIHDDHVQFTGWGHNGWQMELAINLADGELISEVLRQSDSAPGEEVIDGDSMRQTLNFAAVDGIKNVQSVEVTAHAILIQGIDRQGRLQQMTLNLPLLGNAVKLAAGKTMNPDYRP